MCARHAVPAYCGGAGARHVRPGLGATTSRLARGASWPRMPPPSAPYLHYEALALLVPELERFDSSGFGRLGIRGFHESEEVLADHGHAPGVQRQGRGVLFLHGAAILPRVSRARAEPRCSGGPGVHRSPGAPPSTPRGPRSDSDSCRLAHRAAPWRRGPGRRLHFEHLC
jgi:hypothetical protein